MIDRTMYFRALIEKGHGRVRFSQNHEPDTFRVLLEGKVVAELTDNELAKSTPSAIAERVFGEKKIVSATAAPSGDPVFVPVEPIAPEKPKTGRPLGSKNKDKKTNEKN